MKQIIKKMYLDSPDELLNSINNWFSDNKKKAFLYTLIIGLITHIMLFSVLIMSQDALWNSLHFSAGMIETTFGRWAINIIDSLRNNMALPTITTTISIVITSIISIFIVDFFEFKSKISVFITSFFMAVSPCLSMTLLYSYTADAYTFAFLFSVLSAWCIYKTNKKTVYLLSSIFTMLTLATYQSYLGVAIGLCMMKPIIDLLRKKANITDILKNIFKSIIIVAIGIVLYYISEKIALKIYGAELSSYRGASSIGLKNMLSNLKYTLPKVYNNFFNFFFGNEIILNNNMHRTFFYKILFSCMGISLIILLIKRFNIKENWLNIFLIILGTIILPIGINIIGIIAPDTIFYSLNTTQILLIIPFFMVIIEEYNFKPGMIFAYISLIMCIVIASTYYLSDNVSYFFLRLKYQQAYAITLRMVDRIENAENYEPYKPWAIVGVIDSGNTTPVTDLNFYTYGHFVNESIFHGNYIGSIETWKKFIQIFMGIQPNFATAEDYYKMCGTQEFKDMPIFPDPGSVREINGLMVVKFTNSVPE